MRHRCAIPSAPSHPQIGPFRPKGATRSQFGRALVGASDAPPPNSWAALEIARLRSLVLSVRAKVCVLSPR